MSEPEAAGGSAPPIMMKRWAGSSLVGPMPQFHGQALQMLQLKPGVVSQRAGRGQARSVSPKEWEGIPHPQGFRVPPHSSR